MGEDLPNTKTKRTPAQREHDREEVARLLARGVSLRKIRDIFNSSRAYQLSLTQIGKDAKHALCDLHAARERRQDDFLAEILALMDMVERKAWESWETSTADRKRTRTVKHGKKIVQETVITETSFGDPRLLALVLKCVTTRCRLLGLGYRVQQGGNIKEAHAEMIFV